ncbi:hypothetical protein BDM02DRAFT_2343424 [Thelephora ganbajun]|uniref:Uncharacterized protein n=1 Tax=Thelephora ganbajun TaxID=370292 RepID=A0ACB6ZFK9_THEGA|nr:hypothetical protein BDM02DRAFT_2343424 [Thelephora ganbajun]
MTEGEMIVHHLRSSQVKAAPNPLEVSSCSRRVGLVFAAGSADGNRLVIWYPVTRSMSHTLHFARRCVHASRRSTAYQPALILFLFWETSARGLDRLASCTAMRSTSLYSLLPTSDPYGGPTNLMPPRQQFVTRGRDHASFKQPLSHPTLHLVKCLWDFTDLLWNG